ncbi:hypothetical protein [Leifsonia sp. LS-T14]|uniref:DUF7507 domain-containing protein n=1 Tax=unclassified Leifsonia TaxID=2663824 RepID=UPI0035A73635
MTGAGSQQSGPKRRRGGALLRVTAAITAALLAAASAVAGAGAATAAPGSPGVPQAPATAVYAEDFQNAAATNGIRIGQYTGGAAANASTYVTSPNWAPVADQCNGWILRSNTPRNTAVTSVDSGCDATAWSFLQGMATAIGLYRGEAVATAQQNQILSEYTNGGSAPGPGVEFQTAKPITGTIVPGHFYQISAIYGAANCVSEGPGLNRQDPSLSFNLIQNQTGSGPAPGTGGGTVSTLTSGLNPCTDPAAQVITTAGHTYHIARLNSAGFRMPAGVTTLGIQLFNAAGSFRGNDSGFDDPQIVDATPQLDKVFSPTTLAAGQSTTLTFTVTNTDELAAKNGWSFTDTLPAGLTFSGAATTDCPAGVATLNGTQISGSGNLDAGTVSCTFTVPVTSAVAASYTNGPSNIGPIDGLLQPGDSTVVFNEPDAPAITLVKSASLTDPSQYVVGAPVTYSFFVANTGNVPLSAVTVTETAFSGTGTPPTVSCPTTVIPVNESTTCTGTYTITQADVDAGQVTNTASVTGNPPTGPPVTDTSDAVVSGTPSPALDLVKTADASGVQVPARAGDPIRYRFTVTNTGNVSLQNVTVADPRPGLSPLVYTWPGVPGVLEPQQSATATATYAVTQADLDAGTVANTATANGTTTGGTPVPSEPASTKVPLTPAPGLTLAKTAAAAFATPPVAGDPITYTVTITNSGNVTLHAVNVADLLPGLSTISYTWPAAAGVLAPTEQATGTASYPITQSDIDAGHVANTAIAHGATPDDADTPSNEADTDTPIAVAPALALTKSADASGIQNPTVVGDPIVYRFTVTNTGDTTLTGVAITDALAGLGALGYTWPGPDGVLQPGQSAGATATYVVSQTDINAGQVTNTATASGTAPDDSTVNTPPVSIITPLGPVAALSLVKSASPSDAASFTVGRPITYSFVITNTGNVPVSDLAVMETAFSGSGIAPVATCPPGTLAPGDQATCTAPYTLTQADIDAGQLANTATASGTDPAAATVTSNDSSTLIPAAPAPALTLAKTASIAQVASAGQVVTYTYTITNVGSTTLTAAAITETTFTGSGTAPAPTCPPAAAALLPGAAVDCTADYTVTAADLTGRPLLNTATAAATAPGNITVTSDPATASVATVVPAPPTPTPTPPAPPAPDTGSAGSPLASTGSVVGFGAVGVALALMVAGTILLSRHRRRRT